MERTVYVDHSATTSVRKEVLEKMLPFFNENYGNPSSTYKLGLISHEVIEEQREKVADCIGANYSDEIYFTSGGSESDNMIIKGIMYKNKSGHMITSKIEHKAVINTCKQLEKEGYEVTYLNVDKDGFVSINDIKKAIKDNTRLISIMFANNEIGTIQQIEEIGKLARFKGIYFHTDAVQAIGNISINVEKMCIDALSLSAHKFYGPKGVGVAYIRKNIDFLPLILGGGQERNKRAGTENVAGIVGLGEALKIATDNVEEYNSKLLELRNAFIDKLKENFKDVVINGSLENRLPGNVNFYIPKIKGSELITLLSMDGICVSGGSACNLNKPSYVLKAINKSDDVSSNSIRVTFGKENTIDDVNYIIEKIVEKVKK